MSLGFPAFTIEDFHEVVSSVIFSACHYDIIRCDVVLCDCSFGICILYFKLFIFNSQFMDVVESVGKENSCESLFKVSLISLWPNEENPTRALLFLSFFFFFVILNID